MKGRAIFFKMDSGYKLDFTAGGRAAINEIRREIERRLSFIKDALIGQSPEDLERHYKLIGRKEAFDGLLEFINQMD